jgi:hypothetical protein
VRQWVRWSVELAAAIHPHHADEPLKLARNDVKSRRTVQFKRSVAGGPNCSAADCN